MKLRLRLWLLLPGSFLWFANTPALAGQDGKELFQAISLEMAEYEAANHLSDLMTRIQKTIASAKIRSIEYHEYTITRYPDLFYDVSGLKKGQHPYHTTGDWDCDGKQDQAVILREPRAQIAVVLSSGMTLSSETTADGITAGKPSRHSTAPAKAFGDGEGSAMVDAKCGFINAEFWGKSSVALVVDLSAKKLVEHQLSD